MNGEAERQEQLASEQRLLERPTLTLPGTLLGVGGALVVAGGIILGALFFGPRLSSAHSLELLGGSLLLLLLHGSVVTIVGLIKLGDRLAERGDPPGELQKRQELTRHQPPARTGAPEHGLVVSSF